MKNMVGQQMKAVSGLPFPLVLESHKTVGHIFMQIVRKFSQDATVLEQI